MKDEHSKPENPSSAPNYTAQLPAPRPNPLRGIPGGRPNTRPLEGIPDGSKPSNLIKPTTTSTSVPEAIFNAVGIAVLETIFPPVEDPYHILRPPIGDPIVIHEPREPIPPLEINPPNQTPAPPIKTEPAPVPNYPPHPVDGAIRNRVNDVMSDPRGNTSGKPSSPQGIAGNNQQPTVTPLEPLILYPPGQSPIEIENRNRVQQANTDQRRDSIVDQDGNVWSKPKPERPSQIPPNSVPNDDWMRPAEKPNSPLDFPEINTPIPGLNFSEPHRNPQISGGRSTWQPRASQEAEPENPESPNSTENSDQPNETPAANGNADAPATRQTGQPTSDDAPSNQPAPSSNAEREAQKRKRSVERVYSGRRVDQLTDADKERIREGGYTLVSEGDHPQIRRTRKEAGDSNLHLEQVDGVWLIKKGPAPVNNRDPSNTATMWKNFLEESNITDKKVLDGFSLHHSISVNVWKKSELTQLAEKYGVAGVDDAEGLIAVARDTADLYSVNPDITRLEKDGQLSRLLHPGSHDQWDKRVKEAIKEEEDRLKSLYDVTELDQIPADKLKEELKASTENIRKKLREELKYASEQIKAGKYDQLPKYIKEYLPLDPKRPGYVKISDRGQDNSTPATRQYIAELRANFRNFIATANTFSIENTSNTLLTNSLSTNQEFAQMLAISASRAIKGKDTAQIKSFSARREEGNINIYESDGITKMASVNTGARTVTMYKQFTLEQKASLEDARAGILADAQAQSDREAHASKAANRQQLSLG